MPNENEIVHGRDIDKKPLRQLFIWAKCCICGKGRWVVLTKGKPIYQRCLSCGSLGRTGIKNSNWKGGRYNHGDGYIRVRVYPNDFFYPMADKQGYVFEHRLVMAKHLNRCLLAWETVHHKNEIRNDNRIENLILFPTNYEHHSLTRMKNYIRKLEKEVNRLTQMYERQ